MHHYSLPLALILSLLLTLTGVSEAIEQSTNGLISTIHKKQASDAFVVVEMDAKSVRAIGQWPWPRQIHAQLIDSLAQHGASQIAFDVDFSSASNSESDNALAASIANSSAPIILATFKQRLSDGSNAFAENLPLSIFSDNAMLASVNVIPNESGYIAQYPYAEKTGGQIRPSLAAFLAGSTGNIGQTFHIDQRVDIDSVRRISLIDVINDRVDPQSISGKSVIIGATAIELGDRYATPAHGVIPGVIIHAMAADTIYNGADMQILDRFIAFTISVILMIIFYYFFGKAHNRIKFKLSISLTIAAVILVKYFAYQSHFISIEIGLTLAFLISYLIINIINDMLKSLYQERMYDSATGLPNSQNMIKKSRHNEIVHIAVAQINNFSEIKTVCDSDQLNKIIKSVASRLELLADSNIIYRTAADQLAWVINPIRADKLQDQFDTADALLLSPVQESGQHIKLNVNCGYIEGPSVDCLELLSKASIAANKASIYGYRWSAYSDDISKRAQEKLTILSAVDDAIENGDIWIAYQPKINLSTKKVESAEALVRWQHSILGNISPDRFIPILETENRMSDLTLHILRQTIEDIQNWYRPNKKFKCSINVSAALLLDDNFVENCINIIDKSSIDNEQITLEITETSTLENIKFAARQLKKIRQFDIHISIDDYGTGQSTLSYLRNFSASEIKIDQSFIKSMIHNDNDRVMVSSTIDLAHSMNLQVVAEGVEDPETYDILEEFGCDVIQGWHIGKAVDAKTFADLWIDNILKKAV